METLACWKKKEYIEILKKPGKLVNGLSHISEL